MKPERDHEIRGITASAADVKLELANGVTVMVSANKGYLHLSFSGIGDSKIVVGDRAANYVNIAYTAPKQ